MAQLDENLRAMAEPWTPADEQLLAARFERIRPDYCSMCGQCEGTCPKGLPVADVLRFLTYAEGYGQFALGREHFGLLPAALRDVRCGDCAELPGRLPAGRRGRAAARAARRSCSPEVLTGAAATDAARRRGRARRLFGQPRGQRLRERQRILTGRHVRDARDVSSLAEHDDSVRGRGPARRRPPRRGRGAGRVAGSAPAASRACRPPPARSPPATTKARPTAYCATKPDFRTRRPRTLSGTRRTEPGSSPSGGKQDTASGTCASPGMRGSKASRKAPSAARWSPSGRAAIST